MKPREKGVVRDWDDEEGFGHIQAADGTVYWAHFSVIDGEGFRALRAGQPVTFRWHGAIQDGLRSAGVVWPG
jgi:CspA family cold shock protein